MDAETLRNLQAPLKTRYRSEPAAAQVKLSAHGRLEHATVSCALDTPHGVVRAGLHPATGGDGSLACSGDMLLEALVACSGVTLSAVATALGIPLRGVEISAEGDLDFRGTLGVSREVPVGFSEIRLRYQIDTDAPDADLDKLLSLTERYCVVYQTLRTPPRLSIGRTPGR